MPQKKDKTPKEHKKFYPERFVNTYAAIITAGPDRAKAAGVREPNKYLSQKELEAWQTKPRAKKK